MRYETVIGLEVHIQLDLKSKIFTSDSASFGGRPNTHVGSVSLGHPGTLPVLNEKAIDYAVRLGLACKCDITERIHFDRKHYFYADLPKGYQITQHKTPICNGGSLTIHLQDGTTKEVLLDHIHLEEDAGKSIHDADDMYSLIDLNRAGVALMEMVTQPVLSSPEEAHAFVTAIRKIVRYINVCDGNMEEGSLRCDANISLRPVGSNVLGTKVEIKNLNSMRFMQRALQFEIARQEKLLSEGKTVIQETRGYDSHKDITFSQRDKESAHDYRYFPEPDIPPYSITREFIEHVRINMPSLPHELIKKYTKEFGLATNDAVIITDQRELANYFDDLVKYTDHYIAASKWLLGTVRAFLNENNIEIKDFVLSPNALAQLINLVEKGVVSHSAAQKVLIEMINHPGEEPMLIIERLNLLLNSDAGEIQKAVEEAFGKYPEKVAEYKKGRKGLLGLFVGEAMKLSGGKADPKIVQQLMKDKLDSAE